MRKKKPKRNVKKQRKMLKRSVKRQKKKLRRHAKRLNRRTKITVKRTKTTVTKGTMPIMETRVKATVKNTTDPTEKEKLHLFGVSPFTLVRIRCTYRFLQNLYGVKSVRTFLSAPGSQSNSILFPLPALPVLQAVHGRSLFHGT